ncbi:unnamed protein product [Clonostachys solani]|uniref:Heterokaryon incompatibility domain-containing protein n=1 Tax=Clonostachys solani TaxID=160281 RepID=A0A9N9W851_9HYPO|nr:unnamed protein product [Clonostachys solani]
MEPHSCVACQSRLIFTLKNHAVESTTKGWYEYINENYYTAGQAYVFNISYEQAISQARRGCELFMWLVTLRRPDTRFGSFLRAYLLGTEEEQLVLDWVNELKDHIDGATPNAQVIICADEGDAAASEITHRPPNWDPASKPSMQKNRDWLDACDGSHIECQNLRKTLPANQNGSKTLAIPRRLIEITNFTPTPTLRLIETDTSRKRPYTALSYCWGGDQKLKLLQQNIVSLSTDIPYLSLPSTIRDAVHVSTELGFEHIWIDALCIIQDSDHDKMEEISRMGEIYEQAALTISAARAKAVDEGFLKSRYIPGERGFRIPYLCQDGKIGCAIFWKGREPGFWDPIHQRAWCLQESILSPRVLEFGTHNTRWHCIQNRNEDSSPEFDGWIGDSRIFTRHHISSRLVQGMHWAALEDPDVFTSMWESLIMHYTCRGIGFQEDRLLAISAIARKMGHIPQKEYMAGLWQEGLTLIMWKPSDAKQSQNNGDIRPKTYVAPSWSWASIGRAVEFPNTTLLHDLKIIDVEIRTPIPSDEFSAVISATLTIRTLAVPCRFKHTSTTVWSHGLQQELGIFAEFDLGDQYVLDVQDDGEGVLAWISTQGGLVLKKHAESVFYSRVGVFSENFGFEFSECDRKEMEVVII